MNIIQAPSPNYWPYNAGYQMLVLHGTAGDGPSSLGWLRSPNSQASANYMIFEDGTIYCLVDPYKGYSAWGNGIPINPDMSNPYIAAAVQGNVNLNTRTISIEHVATSKDMIAHKRPMPAAQLAASQALSRQLCRDFSLSIVISRIVGHYQIDSVTRINCPGVIDVPGYVNDLAAQGQTTPTELKLNGCTIRGEILKYWQKLFNPLLTCGNPLSNEFVDPGDGRITQQFERAVLKFYPEMLVSADKAPWCVQGVLLGSYSLLKSSKQPQPSPVASGPIGAYYNRLYNPTLICGYPISAVFTDSDGRQTQAFERGILKYYPEYANTDWAVQGVRLGAAWLPTPRPVVAVG